MKRPITLIWVLAVITAISLPLATAKSGKTVAARAAAVPASVKPSGNESQAKSAFFIGVWYQPRSSWQKWRDRGITWLVGIELENGGQPGTPEQQKQYIADAHAFGFKIIAAHPDADIILNKPDEPDGGGNTSQAAWIANYKQLASANPGKDIFGNFDGEKTRWRPENDYTDPQNGYLVGCTIAGVDWYPGNRGLIPEGGMDIYTKQVQWTARVCTAAHKKFFVAIECCDQDLKQQDYLYLPENQPQGKRWASQMRGPTPDEMEFEINVAMQAGASGIFYFPHKIGKGWEGFDGTTEDVAIRMRTVDLKLTSPLPQHTVGSLNGKTITIDGFDYTLDAK